MIYYLLRIVFRIHKNKKQWGYVVLQVHSDGEGGGSEMHRQYTFLPTMSFLIASVIGIGLAASGEIYLVKVLTASRSIPTRKKYRIKPRILWHQSKMRSELQTSPLQKSQYLIISDKFSSHEAFSPLLNTLPVPHYSECVFSSQVTASPARTDQWDGINQRSSELSTRQGSTFLLSCTPQFQK